MIAAVTERPRPAAPLAAEQIDHIAKTFGIVADPNDMHGPSLREQMLASYIEWLAMEQRCATSALWPQVPPEGFEYDPVGHPGKMYELVPANTRWGDWHFSRDRFPGAGWKDLKHPLTRAAFVLWSVGAIEDIYDPLLDRLKRMDEADGDAYSPLLRTLATDCPAPTTMPGAAAALRFVRCGFDSGESIADKYLVDAVIRFLEREDPRPETVKGETIVREDPVLGVIAEWRNASNQFWSFPTPVPDDDSALDAADKLEVHWWNTLIRCVPTTVQGLAAWTAVMAEQQRRERLEEAGDTQTVIDTMARSTAYLAETAR